MARSTVMKSKSKVVEKCLSKPDIHELWDKAYHTSENDKFFAQVFAFITRVVNAPRDATFLDAGCGSCAHSIRLANHGFRVEAVDFSESALRMGEAKVKSKGLENRIKIQQEDLCALSFEDETFKYILCWGVLMHIPHLEKAICELARVLKAGGTLVVGENNMYSLQALIRRGLRGCLGKEREDINRTPAGLEFWWPINNVDMLMTRHANIRWLIKRFESKGLTVKKRVASQFTDSYTKVSSHVLKRFISSFNDLWFRYIRIPHFALGNIVILEKEE